MIQAPETFIFRQNWWNLSIQRPNLYSQGLSESPKLGNYFSRAAAKYSFISLNLANFLCLIYSRASISLRYTSLRLIRALRINSEIRPRRILPRTWLGPSLASRICYGACCPCLPSFVPGCRGSGLVPPNIRSHLRAICWSASKGPPSCFSA